MEKEISYLVNGIFEGNQRIIAKVISMIENQENNSIEILKRIYPKTGKARVIGITGAPGTGKSTLVDQMISIWRKEGKKIGVIAVDPTSPFSGGAILGDRIRMMRHAEDEGVFIRSMASRGHLGGVSRFTGDAVKVLDASEKDIIIVETVGVGQDEVEIVKLSDLVVLILTPTSGDDIQAFKAGIMEIADVYLINKADLPETKRMETQLQALLSISHENRRIPIIKTIALTGEGVNELVKTIEYMISDIEKRSKIERRRKEFIKWLLFEHLKETLSAKVISNMEDNEIENIIESIYKKEIDPYSMAEELAKRI
ncbi:MAG: methylmalonyl Co-A mutase-associated GTPase MeaB [Candidatus Aminicenantia bacterium]